MPASGLNGQLHEQDMYTQTKEKKKKTFDDLQYLHPFSCEAITLLFTDRKKPIVYIGPHFLYRSSVCGHPRWI